MVPMRSAATKAFLRWRCSSKSPPPTLYGKRPGCFGIGFRLPGIRIRVSNRSSMWALRRASNPLRYHIPRGAVAQAFCSKLDTLYGNLKHEHWDYELYGNTGVFVLPNFFLHGPSFSAMPSLGIRNLSSQAGATTGGSEVDDGFSDLDSPPETDKIGTIVDKEDDDEFVSERVISGEKSKIDSAEVADCSLGLSDSKSQSNGEKEPRRTSLASPFFKVVMEAPRQSFNDALNKWVEEGNSLGRDEISMTVQNLRRRRFYGKALQFLEWLEASKHLDFVERDYASRLDLVAKVHGLQKAEKYINMIPESFRGEIVHRTLLANYVYMGNVKKSEEVFNKIRDHGLPITTFSCNQLFLLYKRVDRKKIVDVLTMMEKENIKPSPLTYRLLIHTKGRANDITGIEQIVEKMKADGVELDLATQALIANHYILGGLNEKAEATLKEIESEDIKENRNACKVLLPLYAALGKAEDVRRIWKVCEANPRLEECFAAIEAWGKLGRVEDAEEVFENMLKTWKNLSSKYYDALLKVYANHKLLSKGKELAKRMLDSGCRIDPLTLDTLVKLFVEAGEVAKADSILQKASRRNLIRPLYSSYMAVLDRYSKRGDIHNAEKIFHRLKQTGYTMRMTQYKLLLEAYINGKTPAYGFQERMKADDVFPNKQVAVQLEAVDAFRKTHISELLD